MPMGAWLAGVAVQLQERILDAPGFYVALAGAGLVALLGGFAGRSHGLAAAWVTSLGAALACLIIFEINAIEIFPALFAGVTEAVRTRANELYEQLQGDPSPATRMKLDFLEGLLARAEGPATENV